MNLDTVQESVNNMISSGVHIIDIGAESTRPNADALTGGEEWNRLEPMIELIQEIVGNLKLGRKCKWYFWFGICNLRNF